MDLREFRETLLRLDRPEEVLLLADRYLTQLEAMGDSFVLPREHVLVKPALEFYAGDLAGWVKFVKGVRDRLPVSGRQYHKGMNELYRKLEIRLTQQERRERLTRAVDMALRKGMVENNYDAKMVYARRCTKAWQTRRDNMLALAAKQTQTGRLSAAEGAELRDEFWQRIDEEIANGELPKP